MMRLRPHDDSAGYTLVELAAGLGITAVIGAISGYLILAGLAGLERSHRAAEQVQAAHTAWRTIAEEIRRGDVTVGGDGSWSVTFADGSVTYTVGEAGLERDRRPSSPVPEIRLEAALTPITVDDTLRAYAVEIMASGRDDLVITSTVRRASRARWRPAEDR